MKTARRIRTGATILVVLAGCHPCWPQIPKIKSPAPAAPTAPAAPAEAPKDILGRTTPRGTVLGFLSAVHKGNLQLATEYLNTKLHGSAATTLAQHFSVVLDRRLPAKLNLLSDKPEGSVQDPLNPDRDLVGTISTRHGDLEIAVERINDPKVGKVWLFSSDSLESIPDAYDEINATDISPVLPRFLVNNHIAGIPVSDWLALLLGIPLLYSLAYLLNRVLSGVVGRLRRRWTRWASLPNPEILSQPTRLLLIAIAIGWSRSWLGISLFARQLWANAATVIALAGIAWLLIRMNRRFEESVHHRLRTRNLAATASILRLTRRIVDLLVIFAVVVGVLYIFGVNPTPALAGLGVGGIAVALAAQKTLENVIGGASMIFDDVVKVGDVLKFGDVQGTVEEIGLRSTAVRTADRTIVSIPNGQIAAAFIETISARDKFWFHPLIGLGYETSAAQLQSILKNVRLCLEQHAAIEPGSFRTRFIAFGASSLDVEVFAYVLAKDWVEFLGIQEGLLLAIMGIVEQAGSRIALPSRLVFQSRDSQKAAECAVEPSPQPQNAQRAPEPTERAM